MGFLNLTMLFALAAVAIPILIHLLHRRRYDVVDWGAMQFLQISQTKRRRLLIEELLLLLVRVGMIALIVLALARPVADASLLGALGTVPRRVVLVLDGSYSMGFDDGSGATNFDRAKRWASDFLLDLPPNDEAAVIVASRTPLVLAEPTRDAERVRSQIAALPSPRANGDWPRALQKALELVRHEDFAGSAQIYLLKDEQRFGWADDETLSRWEQMKQTKSPAEIFVVDFQREGKSPARTNYALAPLHSGRATTWVGQPVRFRSSLIVEGSKPKTPRVTVEVDGKHMEDVQMPMVGSAELAPLSFTLHFDRPGAHVVAVVVQPEPADPLSGDNRQEIKVEVVDNFPVLLIDGDAEVTTKSSTFFLHKALSLTPDPKRPAVVDVRVLPADKFTPDDLTDATWQPRVLVLADVPQLTGGQEQAVRRFVKDGGAAFVIIGSRVAGAAKHYNEQFYQDGKGWLPARLDQVMGDSTRPDQAASLDGNRMLHPSLEAFRGQKGAFGSVRFPRWWKVTPGKSALPGMAYFSNGDPFLIEAPYGTGKVILCTAPLDRTWDTNFPSMWEYPIFVHELIARLGDAGKAAETQAIDIRESDLSAATAEDRALVARHVPLSHVKEAAPRSAGRASQNEDVWWLFLAGVIGFLCVELWLTRRMATHDGGAAARPV